MRQHSNYLLDHTGLLGDKTLFQTLAIKIYIRAAPVDFGS